MKHFIMIIICLFLCGCNGASKAQISLERGLSAHMDVRTAFFIKSWGLNRALITEARHKWIGRAANSVLESVDENGLIKREKVLDILATLNQDIGQDEAIVSESFAYLAFLLIAGERADQYLSQVDSYLESKKPIWKHLSKSSRDSTSGILREIEAWKPLIKDIEKIFNKPIN